MTNTIRNQPNTSVGIQDEHGETIIGVHRRCPERGDDGSEHKQPDDLHVLRIGLPRLDGLP